MLEEDIKDMRKDTGNDEEAVGDETLGAKSLDSEQDDVEILDAKADGAAEDAIALECLELIKNDPQCKRALCFPPRSCFEVTKKGLKQTKQFSILQFKRTQKGMGVPRVR